MTDNEILTDLKQDLQISTSTIDGLLSHIIQQSKAAITTEGITLRDDVPDGQMVKLYAAFLYRKRRTNEGMPRYLRWMLNNRLFSEKAGASNG